MVVTFINLIPTISVRRVYQTIVVLYTSIIIDKIEDMREMGK